MVARTYSLGAKRPAITIRGFGLWDRGNSNLKKGGPEGGRAPAREAWRRVLGSGRSEVTRDDAGCSAPARLWHHQPLRPSTPIRGAAGPGAGRPGAPRARRAPARPVRRELAGRGHQPGSLLAPPPAPHVASRASPRHHPPSARPPLLAGGARPPVVWPGRAEPARGEPLIPVRIPSPTVCQNPCQVPTLPRREPLIPVRGRGQSRGSHFHPGIPQTPLPPPYLFCAESCY